jgi:hypothetical protein
LVVRHIAADLMVIVVTLVLEREIVENQAGLYQKLLDAKIETTHRAAKGRFDMKVPN